MRIHPVRVVIVLAACAAICATYLPWVWIGGIGGVKGWNLGFWTGGNSWLTAAGIQDGYATLVIAASVAPFVVFGDRAERLARATRVYITLASAALFGFAVLEIVREQRMNSECGDHPWCADNDVGNGVALLGFAALAMFGAALFPSAPRPYVEPEYRL